MEGKLLTSSVSRSRGIEADIKIGITRKMISGDLIVWEPRLAPSQGLFIWYLNNKHELGWWETYKKKWDVEKLVDFAYWEAVESVTGFVRSGLTVLLICFCINEDECHRSLVERDVNNQLKTGE